MIKKCIIYYDYNMIIFNYYYLLFKIKPSEILMYEYIRFIKMLLNNHAFNLKSIKNIIVTNVI